MENLKDIHIGFFIRQSTIEYKIDSSRICNFFKCTDADVEQMFRSASLDTRILLKWSKLLDYDFFRLYSHHLILYSPTKTGNSRSTRDKPCTKLPQFRKNIYTREIIEHIIEVISSNQMTKEQVINEYRIPRTTLHKWLQKYRI
ncbi:transposase (plasmid) [Chryseobacterium panacisoli]|uniref:Transposase n=1 Tax=Chryseobacterium panacisoli TaxID=1807141 RepID=A0A5D8ZYP5_9FLAO|nr:transposase [Chryseobacterium panacisoli]